MTNTALQKRLAAATGRVPCDLEIKNARFLDVFSCKWRVGTLSLFDGVIVGLEPGLPAQRTIDVKGAAVVPGFIDAHVHIESSLMVPPHFDSVVLPRGTTTAICDPHELANVAGAAGIQYFLRAAERSRMNLRMMLSSCVPSTTLETNGAGKLSAEALSQFMGHPKVLGLAEMMNVPGVLDGSPDVLDKLSLFGKMPIDGHCPLLRGQKLSAYASAGISSCHESSELEEAREKIVKGMSVWIREGSVAKDLDALAPLITMETSTSIGFCTDDRNPYDILNEGHIDHLIRKALGKKISPEIIYRAASWSVARHYGLDRGIDRIGAIAPGFSADLVVLDDVETCAVRSVFRRGQLVADLERPQVLRTESENTVRAAIPEEVDLCGPEGRVHIIGVDEGKIITKHLIGKHSDEGVMKLSVLERYGHGSKPANAFVSGFGSLKGAIASSVGHDSHNLIVVGSSAAEMKTALAALIRTGGGFCVVQNGSVLAQLDLPVGGLMSKDDPVSIKDRIGKLKEASRAIGCGLAEPFLQLAFLSLPVIPHLKLTDKGLVDVDAFNVINVKAI